MRLLGQLCGLRSKVLKPLGLHFVAFVSLSRLAWDAPELHTWGGRCWWVGLTRPRGPATRRRLEASAPAYFGRREPVARRTEARREFPPGGRSFEKRHVLFPGPPRRCRGPVAPGGKQEPEGAGAPWATRTRKLGGAG